MHQRSLRKIGILSSGGDSSGMNAAIRATVRAAIYHNIEVYGILRGYKGLIEDEFIPLHSNSVSNIIQRGGTILKTARCKEFLAEEGRKRAYETLKKREIDALVVIGGDGTFKGARHFEEEYEIPIVGLPATIDNDISGTDVTIGYDTALNTIVQAVDKIRDTASSHERLFIIEVMGHECGYLALNGALACGAEAAIIPERAIEEDLLGKLISNGFRKDKNSSLILVSEGEKTGGAKAIEERISRDFPNYEVRISILGYIQRGGSPTANDRILASRMGIAAIDTLLTNSSSCMIGIQNNKLVKIPFSKAVKENKNIPWHLLESLNILSL